MTDRWKYQIKTGGLWGFAAATLLSLFNLTEVPFEEEFFSKKYLVKLIFFLIAGIFIVGYISWKKKTKEVNKLKLSHDNTLNK
jgi:hypothetical protein